jgi:predicted NBD/HSP70 family sugar kinase
VHDQIVEGVDAGIGLIGHYPLDRAGPLCAEGHRGCAATMLTTMFVCSRMSVTFGRPVTYDEFLELAAADDPAALTIAREGGVALGRLIAAVANTLGPSLDVANIAKATFNWLREGGYPQAPDALQAADLRLWRCS